MQKALKRKTGVASVIKPVVMNYEPGAFIISFDSNKASISNVRTLYLLITPPSHLWTLMVNSIFVRSISSPKTSRVPARTVNCAAITSEAHIEGLRFPQQRTIIDPAAAAIRWQGPF